MKFDLKQILLIFLLILALGLRLYRIDATQTFLEDEGRDMLMVQRMLDTGWPVLLGPQTSTGNMYLGPFYYYFITPGLVLSGGHPVGPAILIALTGVLTVYLLFRFAQTWFSYRAAISAAALYALLPYPVMFTRNSWNPNLVPLVMLLLLYVTTKLDLKEKTRQQLVYLFSFGALSGIIVQLHYMALVGVGALGLYLIIKHISSWRRFPIAITAGLLGFGLLISPFILFELRNDFVNSQALVGFTTGTTEDNLRYDLTFSAWGGKVFQTALALSSAHLGGARFMASEPLRYAFLIFFLLLYPLIVLHRNMRHPTTTLLAFVILTSFLVLGFYQENIHLHYLGFLLPVIYLFVVGALETLRPKPILLLVTTALILYSSPSLLKYLNSGATNQVTKAEIVAGYIAQKATGREYNIVTRQGTQTSPFQYFLAKQTNRPSNTLQETLFIICDGSPCNQDDETTTLLYLTGPSHPSLAEYLGHPQLNEFRGDRKMLSSEHVAYGIWVAELKVSKE